MFRRRWSNRSENQLIRKYVYLISIDTRLTHIYTLSLHDALPIYRGGFHAFADRFAGRCMRGLASGGGRGGAAHAATGKRSEEHTPELQSRFDLVCRFLLVKNN